ncbi:hypothetical protein H2203_007699 [Taxawa tesnikishii (nom. ined.)]|nr:hypothetical protein H2203_007699 [Dothideales sp. JES 119]
MIVADAARKPAKENTITPEILEIIALLHHCGFMPQSIYSYTPSDEATSLQQPPTLHLLSSNILTSLSDAAWKAHEKSVVEEARAKGGAYAASRPEIPGSQYNVRIAGLGHEIWLELVLWSCLHGGWILDGASVLGAVARQKDPQRWPILSWREIVTPIVRAGQENSVDWNEVRYLLNSGTVYGNPTLNAEIRKKVRRTVSAEVVAAYADALINIVRVGVGVRGTAPGVIVQLLQTLKRFLETNNLSLGTMSWDSIILRIIESQGVDIEVEPGLAERIIDLSSPFGQEPGSTNSPARNEQWEPQPVYIHDGTAAPLGLTHRILQAYIRVGNLGGALRVLNALQKRTDQDKQRSIEAFFQKTKGLSVDPLNSALHPDPPSGLDFESQYAGIEYPNFFMQLPVTVLAPLLDLIVDAGALDFGTWLLRAQDVDGPVIPESLYADDVMAPALIRFAAAAQDKVLLRKIIDLESAKARGADRGKRSTRFSGQVLVSFLESQLESRNWEAAEKIMDVLLDTPSVSYTDLVAAMLARAMLRQARHAVFGNSDGQPRPLTRGEYGQAFVMLRRFVRKVYGIQNLPKKPLYSVLAVLASINKAWKSLCESLPPPTASRIKGEVVLSPRSFNTVLEGVVDAYIPREDQDPIRVAVRFKPDISTIRIILRKAVEEERKAANWATRQLRSLGLREGDIQEELKRSLRTEKVHDPVSESRAETEEGENEPEARDVDLSRGGETC